MIRSIGDSMNSASAYVRWKRGTMDGQELPQARANGLLRRLLGKMARGMQNHHLEWMDRLIDRVQWHRGKAAAWEKTKDRYSGEGR